MNILQEKQERLGDQDLIAAFKAGLEVWTGAPDSGPQDLTAALDAASETLAADRWNPASEYVRVHVLPSLLNMGQSPAAAIWNAESYVACLAAHARVGRLPLTIPSCQEATTSMAVLHASCPSCPWHPLRLCSSLVMTASATQDLPVSGIQLLMPDTCRGSRA